MDLRKILLTTPSWQLTRKPLFQVRCRQCVPFKISPVQFTICSSVTTDALLTRLVFFQLLRQSGNPWIFLSLVPTPGKEDHTFKLTVMLRPDSYGWNFSGRTEHGNHVIFFVCLARVFVNLEVWKVRKWNIFLKYISAAVKGCFRINHINLL